VQPGDAVVAAAARAPCRSLDMLVENVKMTRAMVAALKDAAPSHVINISSDAVYADEPVPIDEETPTAPGTLHGAMHLAREIAFRSDISAPLTIVRPTLLYGLEDPHNGYGPNRFRRLAAAGENIAVFGAGEERRDHVWIDDLAEILFRILTRRSIGVLNVATGEVHSFRALAEAVAGASRRKVAVEETPRVGPMPHNGYRPFDIEATRAAFPDFAYAPTIATVAKLQTFAEQ
jgi:nucleoside-diphosphate-sugar epimerase